MTDFDRIKDALPLVQYIQRQGLEVKREGAHYKTRCLWHDDHDPSLVLYEDGGYKCFSCGVTGDVIDFAMKLCNWTKVEALNELARCAGITLTPLTGAAKETADKRERLYALMEDSAKLYEEWLWGPVGERVLRYLRETRKLSDATIKAARMGFTGDLGGNALCCGNLIHMGYTDEEQIAAGMAKRSDEGRMYDTFRNRLMIPVMDRKGRIVGFSGRDMGDKGPKYYNTEKTDIFIKGSLIYTPMSRAKNTQGVAHSTRVVVEGHMDAVSALNRDFGNVSAQMGTSLSDQQLDLLCSHGVSRLVFCLDNDTAGETALRRLVEKHIHRAAEKGVALYAMTAPYGKDADDTLREHPELWQAAVDAARPVVDVLIARELAKHGPSITGIQKSNVARALLSILKSDNPFIQQENIATLSRETGVSIDSLESWLISQSHIHVLPKRQPAPTQRQDLPSLEEWVLHGALVNEDPQIWLDRANARLSLLGDYPYALAPLSINDFTHPFNAAVMGQIKMAVDARQRPFDEPVTAYFKGGNKWDDYERILRADTRSAVLGGIPTLDYENFIQAVFYLRLARLKQDLTNPVLVAHRAECLDAIPLLNFAIEDMI